jgi:hypothetical protein
MSELVEFDEVYHYDSMDIGITLPILIARGEESEELLARVDTGSTYCIFRRLHGISLGIEIEKGIPVNIGTATGSFLAFGHEVSLTVLGIEAFSTVYFAESDLFDRNVLGRTGWLNRVKLGLIEPEGKLLLSEYR